MVADFAPCVGAGISLYRRSMPRPPIRARLAAPTPYGRRLANVALAEFEAFHELSESDPALRNRIRSAYTGDLGVAPPANISQYAWSAVFISWCALTAGATAAEFRFAESHSVFVHTAIANAINDRGVFRAWPIDVYAPQIGDIIQNNRRGNSFNYDHARDNPEYPSHSAIVVEFIEVRGTRYAVTVGGNESDSIRRKRVELDERGFIVQRRADPYICTIQTLKSLMDPVVLDPDKTKPSALASSFRKHGTFVYDAIETIADYGSIDLTVAAMKSAGMTHAWQRIHGTSANSGAKRTATRDLVAAMQNAGIGVAGWGWCQGADPESDAALALRETEAYGLRDYVADIEEGVNNAHWSRSKIEVLCRAIREALPGQFGVTTFPLIDWHSPELMRAALPFVHFFNPQVYWFGHPNAQMAREFRRPDGTAYRRSNPGDYMDLCIDRWNALMGTDVRPLVVTGQAYWQEGATQEESQTRLDAFLQGWDGYGRIAGLNWWHFGGRSAMSHAMLASITAAKLATKRYAT
jgi:hypothetical protein